MPVYGPGNYKGMPAGMPIARWSDHPEWFKNAPTSVIHGKRGRAGSGKRATRRAPHLHGDRLLNARDVFHGKGASKNG